MEPIWRKGLRAIIWAVLANVVVWWLGVSILTIPSAFPPLAGAGPTIFFTTVGAAGGTGVFALLRMMSSQPHRHFRIIALIVLILSFIPDVLLLSDEAREAVPGVTVPGVVVLMVMHVVAAVVVVWALTSGEVEEGRSDGRGRG